MVQSSLLNKTHNLTEIVDDNEEIVRMIQVFGRPPIIVLGTIGNVLTFIAMQTGSLKSMSTCFYMAILGLSDTGELSLSPLCYNMFQNCVQNLPMVP